MYRLQPRTIVQDMTVVFFSSLAMIIFEIFLSRFFSVILDYNYVFLIISLATLGIGVGGYLAYKWNERFLEMNTSILGIFSVSMILVVLAMYALPYRGIVFYALCAILPFILGGLILAGTMQSSKNQVHILYFVDLVAAGIGSAGAIFLMNAINPIQTIVLITFVLILVYLVVSYRKTGRWSKLVYTIVLMGLGLNLVYPFLDLIEFKAYRTSPFTVFSKRPDAEIVYTHWDAFSKTDVYDTKDELLYMTIDGSALSPISKYSKELKEVDYLLTTTGALAFQHGPKRSVLIIGAGGGQEVLTAQMSGFQEIDAVDINKGSFDAVHALAGLSGDFFRQNGVKEIISDGRSYIKETTKKYDLIYLSLVKKQSENGLGLALTENFIYTQEALKDYMNRLNSDGRLAFLLHDDTELNKMMYAARKYYQGQGMYEKSFKNYIAVVGTYQHLGHVLVGMNGPVINRPLLILQKQPMDREMAQSLLDSTLHIQQIPIHIPYINDQYGTLQALFNTQHVNVNSNRDNRPFFYNKTNHFPMGLVVAIMIATLVAAFLLRRRVLSSGQAIYFSGIAIGFMLLEVTFIQKLSLPLGHPTRSFVTVLGVLLVAGGIGSYCSKRGKTIYRRYSPLLIIGFLALLANTLVGLFDHSLEIPETYRMFIIVVLLFPLGFFMGMPFPYGLSHLKREQVAMSWGVNGVMTVVGSLLAAAVSLTFGFTVTIWIGAAIYILLFIFQPTVKLV